MNDSKLIFCVFGFARHEPSHSFDFSSHKKYIYCPDIKFEGEIEKTTKEAFLQRYDSDNCVVELYSGYDRSKYTNILTSLDIPMYSKEKIPHDGILSYFYHIKKVLELCQKHEKNNSSDDTIVLVRTDMSIESIDIKSINEMLTECDIVVKSLKPKANSDRYFCFKKRHIGSFLDLYESYKTYLVDFYNDKRTIPYTFPEAVFWYHLNNIKKLKIKSIDPDNSDSFVFKFDHICSESCKHNIIKKLESEQ